VSISANIIGAAKTLHARVKLAEVGAGGRTGIQTEVASKLKALERESRE
jgi:transposase